MIPKHGEYTIIIIIIFSTGKKNMNAYNSALYQLDVGQFQRIYVKIF